MKVLLGFDVFVPIYLFIFIMYVDRLIGGGVSLGVFTCWTMLETFSKEIFECGKPLPIPDGQDQKHTK